LTLKEESLEGAESKGGKRKAKESQKRKKEKEKKKRNMGQVGNFLEHSRTF